MILYIFVFIVDTSTYLISVLLSPNYVERIVFLSLRITCLDYNYYVPFIMATLYMYVREI